MSVLAFLQNAYTVDEESAKQLEDLFANPNLVGRMQYHRQEGLFEGRNYTGLLIKRYFGDLVHSIWWENASPRWGWESKHKFPADLDHMERIIRDRMPSVVLTFGKIATDAVMDLRNRLDSPLVLTTIIPGPHPAARNPDKYAQLKNMHLRLLAEADFVPCQHCGKWSTGGSHCEHCHKSLEVAE